MKQLRQSACFHVPLLLVSIVVLTSCHDESQVAEKSAQSQTEITHQVDKALENPGPTVPVTEQADKDGEPLAENEARVPGRLVTVEEIKARGPRIFCVPSPEGTVSKLGEIPDTPWSIELVALDSPCTTKVRLRHKDGQLQDVPVPHGAYYFAVGRQLGARTLLALTLIEHGEFLPERHGRLFTNEVDPTVIAITRLEVGWSEVSTVIDRDEAVWLTAVDSNLNLMYLQDSLFEHLLLTQEGRPDTDGLYKAELDVLPSGKVVANNPERIGDYALEMKTLE
jgi:hypothetical protein